MEELKRFDQDHRFPIGAGHVIIRGGRDGPEVRLRGTVVHVEELAAAGSSNNNRINSQNDAEEGRGRTDVTEREMMITVTTETSRRRGANLETVSKAMVGARVGEDEVSEGHGAAQAPDTREPANDLLDL